MSEDFRLTERAAEKRRRRTPQRNGPVEHLQLPAEAMAAALAAADGDPRRLLIGPRAVLVLNRPRAEVPNGIPAYLAAHVRQ